MSVIIAFRWIWLFVFAAATLVLATWGRTQLMEVIIPANRPPNYPRLNYSLREQIIVAVNFVVTFLLDLASFTLFVVSFTTV